jgi:hypothetical protein
LNHILTYFMKKGKLFISIFIVISILFLFNKPLLSSSYYFAKSKFLLPIIYLQKKNNSQQLKECFVKNSVSNKNIIKGKILIIGHAYGDSESKNLGVYPKLLKFLNEQEYFFDLIIVAGDLVRDSSKKNYTLAVKQLKQFGTKLLIAPGNHDIGFKYSDNRRKIFKDSFGNFYNYTIFKNNLIFTLDTNINSTIDKDQFEWLKKIVSQNSNIKNIIIATHQVAWRNSVKNKLLLDKHKKWEIIEDNKNKLIKFSKLIEYLDSRNKKTYFFSGSVNHKHYLYCYKRKNITYINSGVGVNKVDSIVIIDLGENYLKLQSKLF